MLPSLNVELHAFLEGLCRQVNLKPDYQLDPTAFPTIPTGFKLTKLIKDPLASTTPNSFSVSRSQVNELGEADRLHHVLICEGLWDRLKGYACRPHLPIHGFNRHTLDLAPNQQPEASDEDISEAILGFNLLALHDSKFRRVTFSGRQDHSYASLHAQVEAITAYLIRQRYSCEYFGGEEHFKMLLSPRLRANVPDDHTRPKAPSNGGFADDILDKGLMAGGNVSQRRNLVLFAKPPWVYTNATLEKVFIDGTAEDDGEFNWESAHIVTQTLKQVWGSLYWMDTRFCLWTTGQKVWIGIRDGTSLICCPPRAWDSEETIQVIAGLTYVRKTGHPVPTGPSDQ
ncbi:hypothetical protein BKA70DRAFT_676790 [Coprinopsis sp. MPI-PUGE-AT-0042]|nr:hypothetical protein BKA70DRAFT_676790 [Coprinopsis sp. MPI-PUGE-AT-0042]